MASEAPVPVSLISAGPDISLPASIRPPGPGISMPTWRSGLPVTLPVSHVPLPAMARPTGAALGLAPSVSAALRAPVALLVVCCWPAHAMLNHVNAGCPEVGRSTSL